MFEVKLRRAVRVAAKPWPPPSATTFLPELIPVLHRDGLHEL
jgi:hypothetical protein